ncbi:unnamed protein product [Adineta ricciae]|uniref:Uncharacterized protein n=1 Tax=Adineta ricciae TaxID=249248 RepID=A0A815X5M4_ADIRI|nr:unnamed protein product [Adineta ricciae]
MAEDLDSSVTSSTNNFEKAWKYMEVSNELHAKINKKILNFKNKEIDEMTLKANINSLQKQFMDIFKNI